jgi:hypothetical protein
MASKGKEIHALEKKIWVIAETFCELGRMQRASRKQFAIGAGIDYDALKTAWAAGRISVELERKIADSAGFDPADPTWVDQNVDPILRGASDNDRYVGRDTAVNFRAMLRRRLDLPGTGTLVRVVNDRPHLADSNLATFSVDDSGQGGLLGDPAPMFLSVVLDRGYLPSGVVYGFRRMRFRFVFDEDSPTRVRQRLGKEKVVEINGATITERGTEHHPEWVLAVDTAILEGEYASRAHPLCVLEGSPLGEEFTAELSVRPMDGSLLGVQGGPLSDISKRRIIAHLCAARLPGTPDTQGWVSLGRQRLRVLRGDRS